LERVNIQKENEEAYYDKWCKMLDKVMSNLTQGILENNFMTYEYRQYYHLLNQGIGFLNTGSKTTLRCGQGRSRVSIDYTGDVYACHNVALEQDFYRGNLFNGPLVAWDYERYMRQLGCDTCDARIFCNCVCPLITIEAQRQSYCKYKKTEYLRLLQAVTEVAPLLMEKDLGGQL
jgi:radical SAM protein with 4Fe4S-binding SPASM domain